MKILISDSFDKSLPERLKKYGEVTDDKNQAASADVVLIRSKTKCTQEYMDAAPQLKLIIRGGVGLDNVDKDAAKAKSIKVLNTPEASSVAVAELAFAMMIALPNQLVRAHNTTAAGQWLKKEIERTELFQKTLGIIGCGRIGQQIAKRARAFEMKVYCYDVVTIKSEYIEKQIELEALLPICDYLSLNLPLNPSTQGLINRDRVALMKRGVYLINTGRGKTVVEEAIADGLKAGQIAGFATDVFYAEPPESSPLLTAPNVLLAPHIGANSKENLLRIGDQVVELIDKFSKGIL